MHRRLWLSILEGPDARSATPLVTTEDAELIQAVGRALAARLAAQDAPDDRAPDLRLVPEGAGR